MYIRLEDNLTKKYYQEIVEKALVIAKEEYEESPDIPINISLYNQLLDIKRTVISEHKVYTEDEADQKYSLGIMAIRNFDGYENFDYKDMLVDVAFGISLYPGMPIE
jgi:hypothetical protein